MSVYASAVVLVEVPTILRSFTGGERAVQSSGSTLREVVADLDSQFPGVSERLVEDGQLRRFVNVYINDEDVRFLAGLDSEVLDEDTITILPAVAGGQ